LSIWPSAQGLALGSRGLGPKKIQGSKSHIKETHGAKNPTKVLWDKANLWTLFFKHEKCIIF